MSMKRRSRQSAGVLALVALGCSFAEGALASTCAPVELGGIGMDMTSDRSAAEVTASEPRTAEKTVLDVPEPSCPDCAPADRGDDEHDGPCPFGPVMGAGCTAPASVGAPGPALPPQSGESRVGSSDLRSAPTSRPSDVLFHPPRV